MIKINLLPEVKRKAVKKKVKVSREVPYTWIIAAVIALLVTVALLGAFHVRLIKDQKRLQNEITDIKQEISALKVQQGLVEKAREQRNQLAQKLEIISTLKRRQIGPVQLLDQLAGAIPARLWLSEMSESGNAMTVTGFSTDHKQIALFMQKIKKTSIFTDVELINATSSREGGRQRARGQDQIPVKEFEITCRINYSKNQ